MVRTIFSVFQSALTRLIRNLAPAASQSDLDWWKEITGIELVDEGAQIEVALVDGRWQHVNTERGVTGRSPPVHFVIGKLDNRSLAVISYPSVIMSNCTTDVKSKGFAATFLKTGGIKGSVQKLRTFPASTQRVLSEAFGTKRDDYYLTTMAAAKKLVEKLLELRPNQTREEGERPRKRARAEEHETRTFPRLSPLLRTLLVFARLQSIGDARDFDWRLSRASSRTEGNLTHCIGLNRGGRTF